MTDHIDETTGELVPVTHTARTVDMRDRVTDSWTDVLHDVATLARGVAATEFVPQGLRCKCGRPADCTCGGVAKTSAAVLYGRELGLPPMTGLGSTHVIEGKAGISAELMRALVLQAGHELSVPESTRERCRIRGRRRGTEEWTEAVWTIQEAHQTQVFLSKDKGWGPLSAKSQWKSWPTEMLLARATTRLVRMIFPDVAHGMRTVEELQDMTEVVDGEVVEERPTPAPVTRKRATARKRTETPAEPVEADTVEEQPTEEAPAEQPAPVQRARVARPQPRTAPAKAEPVKAPEEPAQDVQVDTLPDDGGDVVDAEIVNPDPPPAEDDKARKGATTAIVMHWERLGVKDRDERVWYTGVLAGREITSTKDLQLQELREVAHKLERCRDLDAVEALIKDQSGGHDPQ